MAGIREITHQVAAGCGKRAGTGGGMREADPVEWERLVRLYKACGE